MSERQLKTREASQVLARWYRPVTPGTMRNWRYEGTGPRFTEGRPVTYKESDVIAWAIDQLADEPRRMVDVMRGAAEDESQARGLFCLVVSALGHVLPKSAMQTELHHIFGAVDLLEKGGEL